MLIVCRTKTSLLGLSPGVTQRWLVALRTEALSGHCDADSAIVSGDWSFAI
jgi:hypothetical protein